jgi:predicted O-methyltransferase YrrM
MLKRGTLASCRPLQEALEGAVTGRAQPDERLWIDRIESLRTELSTSTETVDFHDFGACGDPDGQPRARARLVGDICRSSSKTPREAHLLFSLVRRRRASTCLELGALLGLSAAYQGAALELSGHGRLVTIEGATSLADRARTNLASLGLKRVEVVAGRFQDVLPGLLPTLAPIDHAFIDGHHDGEATIGYFRALMPYTANTAVLVFDDIDWSRGMRQAWQSISADRHVAVAVDLQSMGICVVQAAGKAPSAISAMAAGLP